jgi:tetratricopeptide (TPR) repeat protein
LHANLVLDGFSSDRGADLAYATKLILMIQGHYTEALENFMTAKRLVTETEPVELIDQSIATALLANGRFPEAIAQARLAIAQYTREHGLNGEYPWLALIAAESANGQDAEAHADLRKFLATPRSLRSMAEIQKTSPIYANNPKMLEDLRRAGMPEE